MQFLRFRNWRWWVSRKFRIAADTRKQAWYIYHSQLDLLPPQAIEAVAQGIASFDARWPRLKRSAEAMAASDELEQLAGKWLRPYPHAGTRQNIHEFLVSGVVVLTLFTFFLQPMKIPSGSAQPTLYGNVVYDLAASGGTVPNWPRRILDWFRGFTYYEWVANDSGELEVLGEQRLLGFIRRMVFRVGQDTHSVWWPPDHLLQRCGAHSGQHCQQGELVFRIKIQRGDRLFVDRFTYHWRRPKRGEIIVFSSAGIQPRLRPYPGPPLIANTHYIKRLVAFGGEKVQIGNDRHLIINGKRLDTSTPHFEKVFSFKGPPQDSVYSGYVNEEVGRMYGRRGLAPFFPNESAVFTVRPGHYLAFGDNTMNSFDGRAWGDFPRTFVVGRAFFTFWPFSSRFGPIEWW